MYLINPGQSAWAATRSRRPAAPRRRQLTGYAEDFQAGAMTWKEPLKAFAELRDAVFTGSAPMPPTGRLIGLGLPVAVLGLAALSLMTGTGGGRRR